MEDVRAVGVSERDLVCDTGFSENQLCGYVK